MGWVRTIGVALAVPTRVLVGSGAVSDESLMVGFWRGDPCQARVWTGLVAMAVTVLAQGTTYSATAWPEGMMVA